jgi:hypothetical protein
MKIATALQIQKALTAEIAHLRELEQSNAWSYRSMRGNDQPDAQWQPNFDMKENHAKVLALTRLHTKIGQAISKTNLDLDVIGINDEEFKDWN